MARVSPVLFAAAIAIALAAVPSRPSAQPSQAPKTCFNLRDATDFKVSEPGKIRVKTRSRGSFEIGLSGPACRVGKSAIAIQKAPVADLCIGYQDHERVLEVSVENRPPVRCIVGKVERAVEKPVAPKAERRRRKT